MNKWGRALKTIFKRLRKEPEPTLAETAPLHPSLGGMDLVRRVPKYLEAGSAQSFGLERQTNEDALLMLYGSSVGAQSLHGFGLFCVADGAGGHGHGELASSLAVRAVAQSLIEDALLEMLELHLHKDRLILEGFAKEALSRAHHTVLERAQGGVTTLTLALLMGSQLTVGHVGDCRAYLSDGDEFRLLTRDHSYPWRLVEKGEITPEEALDHPKRNLLWNAIGQGAEPDLDLVSCGVPRGGHLLLCSDGLWAKVSEPDLQAMVLASYDPNTTCEELVQAATLAGGYDNITVILVAFPGAG